MDKFRGNVGDLISQKQSEELIAAVQGLEAISDLRELTELLTVG